MISNILMLSQVKKHERFEPEYYDPTILQILECDFNWHRIGEILDFGQYGLSLPLNENNDGFPIFRLNEIENGFLTIPKKYVKIDQKTFEKFKLKKNDVLYCRTNGSLRFVGRVGLFRKTIKSVFASYLVRLRPKQTVLPEYLMVFLHSSVGRKLIERQTLHSNQFNLSLEQMKKIPIPVISNELQNKIKTRMDKAWICTQSASRLYTEAENKFNSSIGLNDTFSLEQTSYQSKISDTLLHGRIDAEYFNPVFEKMLKKITTTKNGWNKLTNIGTSVGANFCPQNHPNQRFQYVELSDVETASNTIKSATCLFGNDVPSRGKRKLMTGDVIVSRLKGSADKVALVSAKNNGSIASTGFFQFRTKSIPPEVLLVMSTSTVLQSQLRRESTGTILAAVPNSAIRKFVVPKISKKTEAGVVSLVKQSHKFKQIAVDLLAQCISDVDAIICTEYSRP